MSAFEEWWMEFLNSASLLKMTQTEQCHEAFKAGKRAGMFMAADIANHRCPSAAYASGCKQAIRKAAKEE